MKSNTENEIEIAKIIVDLNKNQDQSVQNWVKFFLALQSGLVVGFWFALNAIDQASSYGRPIALAVCTVIPTTGAYFSIVIGSLVVRELKWQTWWSKQIALPDITRSDIFPNEPGIIERQETGYIASRIRRVARIVAGGWVGVALFGGAIATGAVHIT